MLELSLHLCKFVCVLGVKLSYALRVAASLSQRLLKIRLKLSNLRKVGIPNQLLKSDSFLLGLVDFDRSWREGWWKFEFLKVVSFQENTNQHIG